MGKHGDPRKSRSKIPAFSKGASSANPDRKAGKKANGSGGSLRDKATINRINMYKGGRVKRDKKGVVVEGELARRDRAGNSEITGATGRVQPDRRWFGNTRTIGPGELDKFREEMREVASNPFAVVLKRKKVPTSLVNEAEGDRSAKAKREELLAAQPFEGTFGPSSSRKRCALPAAVAALSGAPGLEKLSGDSAHGRLRGEGQSRRIWAELYKVLDCSDVVVHVVDARDVPGTTCDRVVTHLKKTATHKHLLFVVNKCDLVPNWCVRKWLAHLGQTAPTLAFRASTTKPFGKGALLDVLRQYAKLHGDAKQISVGIVGYPNVGKSAVINSLRAKQVCKVAPIPGETKVWQYVTLTKRADDANAVLKGVVRAERLPDPTLFLVPLLRRCDPKHVRSAYDLPFDGLAGGDGDDAAATAFAEALARKMGRLLRGGEPDVRTVAVQMINDWQRGKLPHFVPPPAAAGNGVASGEPEAAADDLAALEDANEAAAQTALDGEAA
ncbi:GTP binding protein [Aureococcus anophagefferens]|nr:GTP binding protein [Aureococcus anophagefferens]